MGGSSGGEKGRGGMGRLTRVLARKTKNQSAEHSMCIRRVHMWLEEVSFVIQVEFILLGVNAGEACKLLDVCQNAGAAQMEGYQEAIPWKCQGFSVFWVMNLHPELHAEAFS